MSHPLTQQRLFGVRRKVWEPMSIRRIHLRLARSVDGRCPICDDTGVYRVPWTAPIFDEHKGHMGEVSPAQLEDYVAFNRRYAVAVPCWNPDCTATRPENSCRVCGGFGQVVSDGVLTDDVCESCDGFGVAA